jgi:ATP-dependent protease ClpP protease subunit
MKTVNLFGDYGDGVTVAGVEKALREAGKGDDIELQINSLGGDSFEGIAIYNLLQDWKKASGRKLVCRVLGICASAASLAFMACDEKILMKGSMVMIHECTAFVIGGYDELLRMASEVLKVNESYASIYASELKVKADEAKRLMALETWWTQDEFDKAFPGLVEVDNTTNTAAPTSRSKMPWARSVPALATSADDVAKLAREWGVSESAVKTVLNQRHQQVAESKCRTERV